MRRALVLTTVLMAGCGGADRAPAVRHPVAPPPSHEVLATTIAGTDMSPKEVADAAAGLPIDGVPRSELMPLDKRDFDRPLARYRAYSTRQAAAMAERVRALRRAIAVGDRTAARRAWAGVYEHYLLIGAAYGALGDLDAEITAKRMRIERGLWTGESLSALRAPAKALATDVITLHRTVGGVEIEPLDYAIRAHEILEDAQRDMLSGVAAPYSGAGVRATAASLEATYAVIGTLRSLLASRGTLGAVQTGLLGLRQALDSLRRAHGGEWPALEALSMTERQTLNGRLGAALEILAGVPHALETQLPPKIPELRP